MNRFLFLLILVVATGTWTGAAHAGNPFTGGAETETKAPAPIIKSRFFATLVQWQHQLRQQMSVLVRDARDRRRFTTLILLGGVAFVYGAVHAAGPGHGKFVAASYVLSRKMSLVGGLLLGVAIAVVHGLSGVAGVLGLRALIQRGVGETLADATTVTQAVSFGLITLLGIGMMVKNGCDLLRKAPPKKDVSETERARKDFLPWALAIGLVPCPAVVMTMLFCMSMGVTGLGLVLAGCISLGMAATLSAVAAAVVLGKTGVIRRVPAKRVELAENVLGALSGGAIAVFGALFLITTTILNT